MGAEMTTHGDVPGTTILGRPYKPLAVGLIIAATAYFADSALRIVGHTNHPLLTLGSPVAGVVAGVAAVVMGVSWGIRSQSLYEGGLLLALGALAARAVEVALLGNWFNALLPLAMACMAGGAYWLEMIDDGEH